MAMLQVTDLKVNYGVIQAIKGVSFEVNEGEVIALIGANGAGKTTILHTVTGLIAPKSGKIEFEGKDITKMPAHKIVTLGMAHVPEGRRVFADLSVYENLLMGAFTRKDKDEIAKTLEMVYKRFPRLRERKNQVAGTLSGGEQQRIAIARAMLKGAPVVILDEATASVDTDNESYIQEAISELVKGKTLLVIAHRLSTVHNADQIVVLNEGEIVERGSHDELLAQNGVYKTLYDAQFE